MAKTQELHPHQITNIQEIAPNFFVIDIDYSDTFKYRYRDWETDRKSTRLNSSHSGESRMPSSA